MELIPRGTQYKNWIVIQGSSHFIVKMNKPTNQSEEISNLKAEV